jgi:hypothetical protein
MSFAALIEQKTQTPDRIASRFSCNAGLLEQLPHLQPGLFNLEMPGLSNTG